MSLQQKSIDLSELTHLLECCICFHQICSCRLCPECSHPFCQQCVETWLLQHETCPYCRRMLHTTRLVKARFFDELLEAIRRSRCPNHENQPLLLACLLCRQCVCVDCWFSTDHVQHKDLVVPVGIAFRHFHQEMQQQNILEKEKMGDSLRHKMALLFVSKTLKTLDSFEPAKRSDF